MAQPTQIGRLHFLRKRGESIYVYPKVEYQALAAVELFERPVQISVVEVNPLTTKLTVAADTRLCVVRDSLLTHNRSFAPLNDAHRCAARQRVFYELAQQELDPVHFESLDTRAKARAMRDTVAGTLRRLDE